MKNEYHMVYKFTMATIDCLMNYFGVNIE